MPSQPLLEVQALGARAGPRWLVSKVTFQASPGEITVVLGPNGAGKTTLLETIVGLRPSHQGSVLVNGRPLLRFADHAKVFAFLPDAGALPAEATVQTLVRHARSLGTRNASTDSLTEALSIPPLLGQPVGVLSRGEHQRVALFCALALERPIVVLDEPFSAFDPLQLRGVLEAVRTVAASGATIIASIHQLADAEKIADRILLLAEGKAVAFGDLPSLRARGPTPHASLDEVFVSLLGKAPDAS